MLNHSLVPVGSTGYDIDNSLRFNDDDSAYLSRTPSTAGNRKTWTFSTWVKQCSISADTRALFGATGGDLMGFNSAHKFFFMINTEASGNLKSEQVFRDSAAWYHIIVAVDTTQGTASNRVKIYINGSQLTDFQSGHETYPSQNYQTAINNTSLQQLNRHPNTSAHFNDMYLAEVNFVDGQALTPSDFGETDEDYGHWKPKKYTGTYGTNGFYLPFDDAGFLGKDSATTLGSELITNGTFDTDTSSWISHNGGTLGFSSGRLSVGTADSHSAYQEISVTSGSTYTVRAIIDVGSTAGCRVGVEYTLGTRAGNETPSNQTGDYRFTFVASSTGTMYVRAFIQSAGTAYFDNISVQEITNQGNNWTPNNLAATDQMLDSPTNNFCTWNAIDADVSALAEGNLKVTTNASSISDTCGTLGVSSGKHYFEVLIGTGTATNYMVGVMKDTYSSEGGTVSYQYAGGSVLWYNANGNKYVNNSASSYSGTYTTGDVVGVAFDMDNDTVTFYKNNVSQGVINVTLDSHWRPIFSSAGGAGNKIGLANFGQDSSFAGNKTSQGNADDNGYGDFYYTPPTGYLALCTQNLPEPTVVPSEHFNTVLYTGGSASGNNITGVGFQPDLVWIKNRNNTSWHHLFDSIRGAYQRLFSNVTNAEDPYAFSLSTFDSDGFTINGAAEVDQTGRTYAAWNWKANGAGVSNTDGSITSTVSANVDAGFSIVSANVGTSGNVTVGHGLSKAPEMLIVKNRAAGNWNAWHTVFGNEDGYMHPNSTSAKLTYTDYWGAAVPSSTVFGLKAGIGWSNEVIGYAFHSVEGYSKVGSYTGNGSTTDGSQPFVYTGFRPAWLMLKRATGGTEHWYIVDNKRNTYNAVDTNLKPNSSNAEDTGFNLVDFTSNGFKIRTTDTTINYSGSDFIYIAFADNPFKYTNAR